MGIVEVPDHHLSIYPSIHLRLRFCTRQINTPLYNHLFLVTSLIPIDIHIIAISYSLHLILSSTSASGLLQQSHSIPFDDLQKRRRRHTSSTVLLKRIHSEYIHLHMKKLFNSNSITIQLKLKLKLICNYIPILYVYMPLK